MKYLEEKWILLFVILSFYCQVIYASEVVLDPFSIAGKWSFRLDPDSKGLEEKWYESDLPDEITLPGSTDQNGYGKKNTGPIEPDPANGVYNRLTREYEYVGPAWYQKEIEIPSSWKGKHITVFLERCHWETSLWVDGLPVGTQNSLCVPHVYDISKQATPGKHRLTICVDNTLKINLGHYYGGWRWAHSITDETQTNWNGIIGKMQLRADDDLLIDSVKIYPQPQRDQVKVVASINNKLDGDITSPLTFEITEETNSNNVEKIVKEVILKPGANEVTTFISFSNKPRYWDEFDPFLYKLKLSLSGKSGDTQLSDSIEDTFGMRQIGIDQDNITLNGRKLYLRGNLECCIFPLTGYPPMDIDGWYKVFRALKSYGMNHLRFHSWCPPGAAFEAADREGVILQVETPLWDGYGVFAPMPERMDFIRKEVDRIIDAYGNHPSFCLMSIGNELGHGNDPFLRELVAHCQVKDPRHLYTCTTQPYSKDRNDDFYVAANTPKGAARGLTRADGSKPSTNFDFREVLEGIARPYIVHEVGHSQMFANLNEKSKYAGHLKPVFLETYRQSLEEKGLLSEAEKFRQSTGRFITKLYKEHIEQNLRTPNAAGFQLLGIQDFPGQGVALVGLLDAFWESKGIIEAEQFRQFCNSTVPLLRLDKREWKSDEILNGTIEIYHFGPKDLTDVNVVYEIADESGEIMNDGRYGNICIATGGLKEIGSLACELAEIKKAQKLTVSVRIEETEYANSWEVWVYPHSIDISVPGDIKIHSNWDGQAKTDMKNGSTVLLQIPKGVSRNGIMSQFYPVAWNFLLFPLQPRTMGIICDPTHPALEKFPTEFHTNWQWYDLLQNHSDAIILNDAAKELSPIVSFIDDFNTNDRLGAIFEMKAGKGKLLVSSIDLQSDLESRPAAKQMLKSLLSYMDSDKFNPKVKMSLKELDKLFAPSVDPELKGAPKDISQSVLNVHAGAGTASETWNSKSDRVDKISDGYTYTVQATPTNIWGQTAWSGKQVKIKIDCPDNFSGVFHIKFKDIDNQRRSVSSFFNGRDIGPLSRYDGDGVWLKFPVDKADDIVFDTYATSGPNVLITQIVLIPER